jgi:alkyl sulfatase BDS1-like metallo-beta-lactamase superfamily hydrolase
MEAAALEQLGYQSVSGTARNAYLMAAQDLRRAEPATQISGISEDVMGAMTMSQLLDFISVRVNGEKAADMDYQMNLVLSDTGDKALIQIKNSVLVYFVDDSSPYADVTVEMPRKTLEQIALDPSVTPEDVTTTGDGGLFDQFIGMLDVFDPGFNIVIP